MSRDRETVVRLLLNARAAHRLVEESQSIFADLADKRLSSACNRFLIARAEIACATREIESVVKSYPLKGTP